MGNMFKSLYVKYPVLVQWKEVFAVMGLSDRNIARLYREFRNIDVDHSNTINIDELRAHLGLENTMFAKRLLSMFDGDKSGRIDIGEFIVALWNYCTLAKEPLVIFTFDLYDEDGSGELDAEEVAQMLSDVYGPSFNTNKHAQSVRDTLLKKKHVTYDRGTFAHFAASHPALLFPAFMMQNRLQSRIMGHAYWKRMTIQRVMLPYKVTMQTLRGHMKQHEPKQSQNKDAAPEVQKKIRPKKRASISNGSAAQKNQVFLPLSSAELSAVSGPPSGRRTTKRLSSASIATTASSSMYTPTPRTTQAQVSSAIDLLELCNQEIADTYEDSDDEAPVTKRGLSSSTSSAFTAKRPSQYKQSSTRPAN